MRETKPVILAIDDTPANLLTLGSALAGEFDLRISTSGLHGLELAAAIRPDLILLDVMMPEMDGFEVCRRLKADEQLKLTPVIFITALSDIESESRGLALGAADFLTKPLNVGIARQRIRNLIDRETLRQQVAMQREQLASQVETLRNLSTAVEQSPVSVVITDLEASIQYVNPKFSDVTGYTADEVIGQNPRILKSGQMKKEIYVQLWDRLTNGKPWHGELINERKNGEVYWEDVHIAPVMNQTGAPSAYVAVKTDITERKQAEEAMRDSEERLRLALDAATMAAWKWDVTSGKTTWGDNPELLLGPRPDDGYPDFREMVVAEDRELFLAASQKALQGSDDYAVEFRLRRTDGKVSWLFARGRVKRDGGAEPIALTGVSLDITERKQAELEVLRLNAQLKVLATTDQLTGLMNRRYLNGILDHEVIRMARYDKKFSVILMDVDHFKFVNDRHGHQAGDDVLVQISGILAGNVRAVDIVGRWGGEEFLVICPETTLDGATILAEQIRQRIEQHDFAIPTTMSASFGVAACQPGMTAVALIKAVDDALYRAKTMGKNRVVSTTQ